MRLRDQERSKNFNIEDMERIIDKGINTIRMFFHELNKTLSILLEKKNYWIPTQNITMSDS